MKITELIIDKLHNRYNYDVKFNSDVTFLFGTNGCGKTTILNITEAIITGQVFKLFSYEFKKITLLYMDEKRSDSNHSISITRNEKGLEICVNEKTETLLKERYNKACDMAEIYEDVFSFLSHECSLLKEIKHTFNYVYLPLNRTTSGIPDEMRRRIYGGRFRYNPTFDSMQRQAMLGDPMIVQVEELIQKKHQEAAVHIQHINDDFRNEVLRSLIEVNNQNNSEEFFVKMITNPGTVDDVKNIQEKYMELLTSLNILNEQEAKKYNSFFDEYSRDIAKLEKQAEIKVPIGLLLKFQEFAKIKTLIPIAERMEDRKAKALRLIELFQSTMVTTQSSCQDTSQ